MLAGDEAPATAILDRLLHRCHVPDTLGRRYRLRDLEGGNGQSLQHLEPKRPRASPLGPG